MAKLLWGKVYYQDIFAGIIRQEPDMGSSFIYDESYLQAKHPAIAHNFQLQSEAFVYQTELPPFFDNLVAEGWLEGAQTRLLRKRHISRFELLLAFGQDCSGAVSVVDPNPEDLSKALIDINDPKELAVFTSRASLSGVQPKLAIIEKDGIYLPAKIGQLSTHIAKFPSSNHYDLVINEYLTTIAFQHLLPEDSYVTMQLGNIHGFDEQALIIKRFDRYEGKRIHFEEFNQLLDQPSNSKYSGSYKQMADFIRATPGCLVAEVYRLYSRVIAGILLGNSDMHLKNFAMLHTTNGLRLTPSYDQVAAIMYGYKDLALITNNQEHVHINKLKINNIIDLGLEFGLNKQAISMAIETLKNNIPHTKQAILESKLDSPKCKQKILELIDHIWK